jgi:hypothetical protein
MVYYLPTELCAINEDAKVSQIDSRPKYAIFEKPEEPVMHVKCIINFVVY